jgi:AraC-like DNA-binding protein
MTAKKVVKVDRLWISLLDRQGIDAQNVLRRAQLPRDLLTHVAAKLSVEEYFKLWRAVDAEAGDPTLPLRLGRAMDPTVFHPPLFAALCSPNLAVAAKRIAEYKKIVAPAAWTIEDEPTGLCVREHWDEPTLVLPNTLAVIELVFLTQIARIATREQICPLKVESPHPMQEPAAFEAFFGVVPQAGNEPSVTFSHQDARRPFLTASDSAWEAFGPDLRRRLTKLEASAPLHQRVRSVLLESLPGGQASVELIARCFGLSSRTLQRKLRLEGASFKEVVSQTREQLAYHYLTNTSLAYDEISFLLAFEEPSSFFRAFREWTGKTPEAVRSPVGQAAACGTGTLPASREFALSLEPGAG